MITRQRLKQPKEKLVFKELEKTSDKADILF